VAAQVLQTIAADPKHLGARIGATLVLHTWGSALTHHPHVHGIVPGGGMSLEGKQWVACRPGFFLPVRVLSRLFRRRFLEEFQQFHQTGRLQFFGKHVPLADAQAFKAWLAPVRKCASAIGRSTPSARSPDPKRRWPSCRATRTAWRLKRLFGRSTRTVAAMASIESKRWRRNTGWGAAPTSVSSCGIGWSAATARSRPCA
jgi:hypothetical protein